MERIIVADPDSGVYRKGLTVSKQLEAEDVGVRVSAAVRPVVDDHVRAFTRPVGTHHGESRWPEVHGRCRGLLCEIGQVGIQQIGRYPQQVGPIECTAALGKDVGVESPTPTIIDRRLCAQWTEEIHPVVQGALKRRPHPGHQFLVSTETLQEVRKIPWVPVNDGGVAGRAPFRMASIFVEVLM